MSLLIKNAEIIDGTGSDAYKADVFIDKNVISAIGDLKNKDADETIDGKGSYLTPGFIDIDTSSDHYLSILTNPQQADFSKQGVTTIIGGHCGSSLAPILYGSLESIRKWVDINKINVDWQSIKEFLKTLSKFPLGVNFGTFIGHSTVRRSIAGESQKSLSKEEIEVFKKVLSRGLSEGAFGLSAGLGYVHGRQTSYSELKELVGILKSFDATLSVHLRNEEEDIVNSTEEIIKLASETKVKTLISHFRPIVGFEDKFDQALKKIDTISSAINLRFYVYPYEESIIAIYKFLPDWAQEKNLETMILKINDPDLSPKIEAALAKLDFEKITICDAPKHGYLVGKNIIELGKIFELSPERTLLKIMNLTKLRSSAFYKNIDYKRVFKLLQREDVFIASNSASRAESYPFIQHERASGTFTKFLDIVLKEKIMSLPRAIRKITSFPAQFLNIKGRGVIKEGNIADLLILSKDDYRIKNVILAGKSSVGMPLRHNAFQ